MATTKRARKFAQDFSGESLTQTHFKDAVDVNNIVNTYAQTGFDPYAQRRALETFAEATPKTYFEALCQVREVESAFQTLSAIDRQSFGNDPQRWLDESLTQHSTPPEIEPPTAPEAVSAPQDSTPPNDPA